MTGRKRKPIEERVVNLTLSLKPILARLVGSFGGRGGIADRKAVRSGNQNLLIWAEQRFKEASHWGRLKARGVKVDELKRLAKCDWKGIIGKDMRDSANAAFELYWTMHPEHDGDGDAAGKFWTEWVGQDFWSLIEDPVWLMGFISGAIETLDIGMTNG